MSEFSNLLTRLINQKDIKVYSMVKYCELDRSTMYKIMNGKRRPPSEDVLHKMADYMHLTPSERQAFREAYDMTVLGEDVYRRRKNMEDFILNFPSVLNIPKFTLPHEISASTLNEWRRNIPSCAALSTQLELEHTLFHIIRAESHKASGKIGLFLQPDYDFIFGMLTGQLSSCTHLHIEHLFCLSKSGKASLPQEADNLQYLKKLIPIYASDLDYHPHYFYDDVHSHYYNYNLFPCLILTQDYAIACASDYSSGILYHDAKILTMIWDYFHSCLSKSPSLFHVIDSVLDECEFLGEMAWNQSTSYIVQSEPCLIPYITQKMLEDAIYPGFPERSAMLDRIWEYIVKSKSHIPNKNMHFYHTRYGIREFAKTGRISEIPSTFYRPLTPEERKYLLTQLASHCHDCNYHLLKHPLDSIPKNIHICVNEFSGYLLFTNAQNEHTYLIIQEPGLLSDFFDYTESLAEKHLETAEETEAFLREIINEIS